MHHFRYYPEFRVTQCVGFGSLDLTSTGSLDYIPLLDRQGNTFKQGGTLISNEKNGVYLQLSREHVESKETDMPSSLISQRWVTALALLGLVPIESIDGMPKVAYVGSPVLRLCEVILWMDRIRVRPGYYAGRSDPLFKAEIIKYFSEVSRSESSFPAAHRDYYDFPNWDYYYATAFRLTTVGAG